MKERKTTTKIIIRAAAEMYGESVENLTKNRVPKYVKIRSVIYEASRLATNESISQTARALEKDHTTVIHFLRKKKSPDFMAEVHALVESSLKLTQRLRDNALQWTALACYKKSTKLKWELQDG